MRFIGVDIGWSTGAALFNLVRPVFEFYVTTGNFGQTN